MILPPKRLVVSAFAFATVFTFAGSAQAQDKGQPSKLFERLDANRDGKITNEEMVVLTSQRFTRIDVDNDGNITAVELQAKMKTNAEKRSKRVMKRADSNGDGMITREEFLAQAEKRFARVDTDKNGAISMEELEVVRQKAIEQYKKQNSGN